MGFYYKHILRFCIPFLTLVLFSCSKTPSNKKSSRIETYISSAEYNLKIDSVSLLRFRKTPIYKRTLDSIIWCKIKLNTIELQKEMYLVGSDAHLVSGEAFVVSKKRTIKPLASFSNDGIHFFENVFYKYPSWKLPSNLKQTDVIYLKIKGHQLRNRLDFFIEDNNQFFKRMQLEYFWTGAFVFFLFVLIIIVFIYSILLKEYSLIFYMLFILFVIIDFLSFKGFGNQYLWGNVGYLTSNRTYTFCIAFSLLGIFYDLFYNPKKKHYWFYVTFRIAIPLIGLALFATSIISYLFKWAIDINYWCFHFLKYCTVMFLFGHFYLVFKKQIPLYLAIGFSIHLILLYTYQASIPTVSTGASLVKRFLFLNMSYLSYTVEILFVVYYIFTQIDAVKKRYQRLKRRNAHLLLTMNNQYLEAQLKERNELVNRIHNAFGGSIEALKYNLEKEVSTENTKKTIDSFYKNYRAILEGLNTPKLNTFNLKAKIEEYLNNNFKEFPISIKAKINFNNHFINKEKTYFAYYTIIELVTNVIKHASASKLKVKTNIIENTLLIEVIDDGVGFYSLKNKQFGLTSIKDKVNEFNGSFEILKPPKGSHLKIQVPL